MFERLRRNRAWRMELDALDWQLKQDAPPTLPAPVVQAADKLAWRIPMRDGSEVFMSVTSGHTDDTLFVVPVDAAAFYRTWLAATLRNPERPDGCRLVSEMPEDYKYRHAVEGFSHGEKNPVPLARVGVLTEDGAVDVRFTDGVTRSYWLLANDATAFPVVVSGREAAMALAKAAGVESEPLSIAALFAKTRDANRKPQASTEMTAGLRQAAPRGLTA